FNPSGDNNRPGRNHVDTSPTDLLLLEINLGQVRDCSDESQERTLGFAGLGQDQGALNCWRIQTSNFNSQDQAMFADQVQELDGFGAVGLDFLYGFRGHAS